MENSSDRMLASSAGADSGRASRQMRVGGLVSVKRKWNWLKAWRPAAKVAQMINRDIQRSDAIARVPRRRRVFARR